MIIRATENFKNSTLGGFFGEMGYAAIALYSMSYGAKFRVYNLNFIFGDFGRLGEFSKNYLIAFCPHIDCMSMQNLESVALMVSEKRCFDMTDRQTNRRTWLNRFCSSR